MKLCGTKLSDFLQVWWLDIQALTSVFSFCILQYDSMSKHGMSIQKSKFLSIRVNPMKVYYPLGIPCNWLHITVRFHKSLGTVKSSCHPNHTSFLLFHGHGFLQCYIVGPCISLLHLTHGSRRINRQVGSASSGQTGCFYHSPCRVTSLSNVQYRVQFAWRCQVVSSSKIIYIVLIGIVVLAHISICF